MFTLKHETQSGLVWIPIQLCDSPPQRSGCMAQLRSVIVPKSPSVLIREQKPYPVRFSCRRKNYPVECQRSIKQQHNILHHTVLSVSDIVIFARSGLTMAQLLTAKMFFIIIVIVKSVLCAFPCAVDQDKGGTPSIKGTQEQEQTTRFSFSKFI